MCCVRRGSQTSQNAGPASSPVVRPSGCALPPRCRRPRSAGPRRADVGDRRGGPHRVLAGHAGGADRGKTILFATHYLEEADANADRIVLMARGRIVADGPATEIKAKVGSRSISATLPDAGLAELQALPGVLSAERHGDAITLSCSDTDAALGALLSTFPGTRDVEVRGASLEEAFLELTADKDDHDDRDAVGVSAKSCSSRSPGERDHPRALRAPSGAAQLADPLPLVWVAARGLLRDRPSKRHTVSDGIPFPLYFMTGMAAYGAMWGSINPGARIARDRAKGWFRALRITPLRARSEIVAKVLTAYLIALLTLALLYLAGALFGVRLDAAQWFEMTGLLLVGLAPFVAVGIALGHVLSVDALARGDGRVRRPPRPPRRRLRPALHSGRHAHGREAAPLLLARPCRQDGRRKRELARRGLDRRRVWRCA